MKPLTFIIACITIIACNRITYTCDTFPAAYRNLINQSGSDTMQMMQFLDNYISHNDQCLDALLDRGDLLLDMDSLDLATADYSKVLKIDNANVYAWYRKGVAYSFKEEYDSALFFLHQAEKIKTYNSPQGGKAIIDYKVNNKYDVESSGLFYALALAYYDKDNADQASVDSAFHYLNQCIGAGFNLDKCYLYRATIYLAYGLQEKACEDLRQAIALRNAEAVEYFNEHCK
jgi:tetratricopeptide (TPR) repeat protein